MRLVFHRHIRGWVVWAGAIGALISLPMLAGCSSEVASTGNGGSAGGNGGESGTGGSSVGGASGTGGTDCTGSNDGATIVMNTCAQLYCHDASGASDCGGLNLTVDAGIASRLVGVMPMGSLTTDGSYCAGQTTEPYLIANSNPAMGLLIDKTTSAPPCGFRMPNTGIYLTQSQTTCLIQWATTLTSP